MIKTSLLALVVAVALACPDEPFCAECSSPSDKNRYCTRCDYSFLDPASNTCQQVVQGQIANCAEYLNNKNLNRVVCKNCEAGYIITNDNVCFKCPGFGCALCDGNEKCLACFNNMLLEKNVCSLEKKCEIENCDICALEKDKQVCNKCVKGFALNSNRMCDLTSLDCRELLNSDPNSCRSCDQGFFLTSDNKCAQNPQNEGRELIWFWFFVFFILLFGGAFYYYRVYRQRPQRSAYREDYVSVN